MPATRVPRRPRLGGNLEVFDDFTSLARMQKRAILAAAVPGVTVANYVVTGLSMMLPRGEKFTRSGRGSEPEFMAHFHRYGRRGERGLV